MKQILPILLSFLLLTGCSGNSADGYQQITQEEAKEMMDTQEVIILDVREQDPGSHHPGCAGAGRVRQRPHPRRSVVASGKHRRRHRHRGDPRKGFHRSGLLPQWEPQQDGILCSGRTGLHQHLRIRRHQHLAL